MSGSCFPLRAVLGASAFCAVAVFAGCAGAAPSHGPRAPTRPVDRAESNAGTPVQQVTPIADRVAVTSQSPEGVLLGIDMLERQDFAILHGKRIGLLTHPAGVNRFGVSTIDVIRRDSRLNLAALYGPEHGIYGNEKADAHVPDRIDQRTGLHVFSLYGPTRKPTPEMLRGIDVLVIDLQDIGVRSYTFVSCMRLAIEACFENGIEVVVLDRPDPLGGLKVAGPMLDREWMSYVGAFRVPYVHGLTIGELARIAATEPGVLQIDDAARANGRLTVVPMRGWRRDMTWPQTGLTWVPTSPNIPNFEAVAGYAMAGLGAQLGGFRHGIGTSHPFRLLTFPNMTPAQLAAELDQRRVTGLRFVPRTVNDATGRPVAGVFVEIADWTAWHPTELSFHMMQLACAKAAKNPFAAATIAQADLFNKHVGSTAWWQALTRDGTRVNVASFISAWDQAALAFQQESRHHWLYP